MNKKEATAQLIGLFNRHFCGDFPENIESWGNSQSGYYITLEKFNGFSLTLWLEEWGKNKPCYTIALMFQNEESLSKNIAADKIHKEQGVWDRDRIPSEENVIYFQGPTDSDDFCFVSLSFGCDKDPNVERLSLDTFFESSIVQPLIAKSNYYKYWQYSARNLTVEGSDKMDVAKIKELMTQNKGGLELNKSSSTFIQYVPSELRDNPAWKSDSNCHYEFENHSNGFSVCFHCENIDYAKKLFENLKDKLKGEITLPKRMQVVFGTFENGQEKEGVELMENVVKEYGDIITNAANEVYGLGMVGTIKELLLANKNIILHGAPGTGKTYLARQVAASMMFQKRYEELTLEERDQIGFVQFHPSYDYTDFVEGLRPTKEGSFERKDGVFKDFCQKALDSLDDGVDNFDECWPNFLKAVGASSAQKPFKVTNVSGKGVFYVHLNKSKDGLERGSYNNQGEWERSYNDYFNYDQLYRVYRGLNGVPKKALDNYRKAVVALMKKEYDLKEFKECSSAAKSSNFVFIIDEINRGDMSKIFGELFFAIEPSYRGVEGRVKTQYQNLIDDDGGAFAQGFFVPKNVYIIGTMNDIDRSVESMDFAMRRRFTFEEVFADKCALTFNPPLSSEAMKRMSNLNKAIWDCDKNEGVAGLSSAYHVGPAYFRDFKDGCDKDQFWNRRLNGLIKEYLRGTRNSVNDLATLKAAFMKD